MDYRPGSGGYPRTRSDQVTLEGNLPARHDQTIHAYPEAALRPEGCLRPRTEAAGPDRGGCYPRLPLRRGPGHLGLRLRGVPAGSLPHPGGAPARTCTGSHLGGPNRSGSGPSSGWSSRRSWRRIPDLFLRGTRPDLSVEMAAFWNRVDGFICRAETDETVRVLRDGVAPRVTPIYEFRGTMPFHRRHRQARPARPPQGSLRSPAHANLPTRTAERPSRSAPTPPG